MSEADGQVRIKVNLDSNEVDKDIEKLQKTLKEQTASLEKQESTVDKLREKYDKLAQSLAQKIDAKAVSLGIDKIKEKMAELTNFKQDLSLVSSPNTKAISDTEKEIKKLQYAMAEMREKAADDESFFGLKNSISEAKKELDLAVQSQKTWEKQINETQMAIKNFENQGKIVEAQIKAQEIQRKIQEEAQRKAQAEAQKILKSTESFRIRVEKQDLESLQNAFNKIKNSLNSAKNSLENSRHHPTKDGFRLCGTSTDTFPAIQHKNFLKYESIPSNFLYNITENLPHICTTTLARCCLKKSYGQNRSLGCGQRCV